MQRALTYAQSPALFVPLRFLLTAPCFALLAGLLMLVHGGAAFDDRWAAPTLAVTHLFTLGVLTMAMLGSFLQLIPVVAGHSLTHAGRAGMVAWAALSVAALTLAGAFLTHASWLFLSAAVAIIAVALAMLAAVTSALLRPVAPGARPMITGMRLALPAWLITVVLGALLALTLAGILQLPILAVTDVHAAWGLLGWVALLVVSVGFQVIPMFQSVAPYPAWQTRIAAPLLAGLLLAWSIGRLWEQTGAISFGVLVAICLLGFAGFTLWRLLNSTKQANDATSLYWRLSLACLAVCSLLYSLQLQHPSVLLAMGVLFVCGFAQGAVNGMLYKIVPFLLWYHLQSQPGAMRQHVPSIRQLIPDQAGVRQFWWHAAALLAMLGALLWPQWLARPAGGLMAMASLHLLIDLGRATLHCRSILRQIDAA